MRYDRKVFKLIARWILESSLSPVMAKLWRRPTHSAPGHAMPKLEVAAPRTSTTPCGQAPCMFVLKRSRDVFGEIHLEETGRNARCHREALTDLPKTTGSVATEGKPATVISASRSSQMVSVTTRSNCSQHEPDHAMDASPRKTTKLERVGVWNDPSLGQPFNSKLQSLVCYSCCARENEPSERPMQQRP